MNEEPRVGLQVLLDRALNKGTAFSADERSDLHLEGLLPAAVDTLDLQVERALNHLAAKPTDLEQYIYLQELCDRNSTLFYALLMSDPARFIPIVYDPTIADACLTYGHIYRRPQGMYLTKKMQGRFAQVLANWPTRDIRFICVTSGGRIWVSATSGLTAPPSRSASSSSTQRALRCRQNACCPYTSTSGPPTPRSAPTRSIPGFARHPHPTMTSTRW